MPKQTLLKQIKQDRLDLLMHFAAQVSKHLNCTRNLSGNSDRNLQAYFFENGENIEILCDAYKMGLTLEEAKAVIVNFSPKFDAYCLSLHPSYRNFNYMVFDLGRCLKKLGYPPSLQGMEIECFSNIDFKVKLKDATLKNLPTYCVFHPAQVSGVYVPKDGRVDTCMVYLDWTKMSIEALWKDFGSKSAQQHFGKTKHKFRLDTNFDNFIKDILDKISLDIVAREELPNSFEEKEVVDSIAPDSTADTNSAGAIPTSPESEDSPDTLLSGVDLARVPSLFSWIPMAVRKLPAERARVQQLPFSPTSGKRRKQGQERASGPENDCACVNSPPRKRQRFEKVNPNPGLQKSDGEIGSFIRSPAVIPECGF